MKDRINQALERFESMSEAELAAHADKAGRIIANAGIRLALLRGLTRAAREERPAKAVAYATLIINSTLVGIARREREGR